MTPIPTMPDQIATAIRRSRGSVKVVVTIESVAGNTSAAPTPMTTRATINAFRLVAHDAAAEANPSMSRPVMSARFRPKRSPRLPAGSSKPAKTSK